MKILFACRKFDKVFGGVERMAIALMNEMVRRGHAVSLLTWDETDNARAFYEMAPHIVWHKIALGGPDQKAGWPLRFRRAVKVRRLVKRITPDVMIGFQHGTFLALRLFTLGLDIPTVAAERNAPDRFEFLSEGKRRHIILPSFLLADRVTIQCESYREGYPAYLRPRIVTIPNPVFPAKRQAAPAGKGQAGKILLSVGRLSYQKHYDVMIDAFARLAKEFPDWQMVIAGDGEDRGKLEKSIAQYGLASRIKLSGATGDVESAYCQAHLFCLPSRWEGFPNALAEALSHGLPAVGFAGCAGVRDLIRDGETGFLAPGNGDVATLTEALRRAMRDDDLRGRMGQAARESTQDYAPEKIFGRWEKVFRDLAGP